MSPIKVALPWTTVSNAPTRNVSLAWTIARVGGVTQSAAQSQVW